MQDLDSLFQELKTEGVLGDKQVQLLLTRLSTRAKLLRARPEEVPKGVYRIETQLPHDRFYQDETFPDGSKLDVSTSFLGGDGPTLHIGLWVPDPKVAGKNVTVTIAGTKSQKVVSFNMSGYPDCATGRIHLGEPDLTTDVVGELATVTAVVEP